MLETLGVLFTSTVVSLTIPIVEIEFHIRGGIFSRKGSIPHISIGGAAGAAFSSSSTWVGGGGLESHREHLGYESRRTSSIAL